LLATEAADKFDVLINTNGGGPTGQAGAVRLGIARALVEFNAGARGKLKEAGLLDARSARP
jgi:small subunit ribosomal protein S9